MIHESQLFGARLKAERVRRGVSLDAIAGETKIQKAFLESLERGDFSKWPTGEVFRRAYIRDYAAAVGLIPELVLGEFIRLVLVHAETPATRELASLAITFDRHQSWRERLQSQSARAAVLDVVVVLALGVLTARALGVGVWTPTGMLAFAYYPAATVWGCSLGMWIIDPLRRLRRELVNTVPVPPKTTEVDVDPLLLAGSERSTSSRAPQASPAH